nr:hypothetical protein [Tanacetum cinerariifolium]
MANLNPEDPNVPNEDVLEEDPYHLLDYDEEEDPKMDIEEEEPEEDPVKEPEPLAEDGEILFRDGSIMPPKPMSEARMREIIRDQFATSMNEFMANINSRAGGPGGASGSGGAGGSGGIGGNADGTGFATSMNEFMANINSRAGGPGRASGSGGAGGSGGIGGNADGTGVRGTGPTVPELTGCTYATFIKCDPLPFIGTEGAVGLCQWTKAMGIEAANNTPWSKVKKWMTED